MESKPVPPEEVKGEEGGEPQEKQAELKQTAVDKVTEVTVVNKGSSKASPFISQAQDWDNEHLNVPEQFRKNLQEMGFLKPSKIQAATIPLATCAPFENLIVQAPAGSGKTGAFAVTTLMRVDQKLPPD